MVRRLAMLALLGLSLPALAEEAPAPAPAPAAKPAALPDRIEVPLTEVPNEALPRLSPSGAPTGPARTGVFVQQPSLTIEFDEGPAEDGARTWTGTLEAGSRKVPLRLRRGADSALTLVGDLDGDGKVDPAKDAVTAKGAPWMQAANRVGTEWNFEGLRLAGAPVLLVVRERQASLNGQALTPGRPGAQPAVTPLTFSETVPEAVKSAPRLEGKVRYATAKVGGKDVVAAVARGSGDDLTFVWADAASGDLAGAKPVPMTPTPVLRTKKRVGTRWQSAPVAWGGEKVRTVVFQVFDVLENVSGTANAPSTRRGSVQVAGTEWLAFLMDGDLDGSFTGPDDWWWLGPKQERLRPNPSNMTEGNEPRFVGDDVWRLAGVGKDGVATFAKAADGPSFEDYLRRRTERVNATRWFPRFAEDKDFAASRGLDLGRPLATKPAAFHFARTLADAKALAAKEGKPLLVDFEADWCPWCKRLDYHTYPDREVAETLSAFTAVKINTELDPADSVHAIESPTHERWTGIPAIGVFDPDGNPLLFRMPAPDGKPGRVVDHVAGWKRPEEFVAALRSALEQWKVVKAGGAPLKVEPTTLPPAHPNVPPPSPAPHGEPPAPPLPPAGHEPPK